MEENKLEDTSYCPICSSCGEFGCCSAAMCVDAPNGRFCNYSKDAMKEGYKILSKMLQAFYADPEKYKDAIDLFDSLDTSQETIFPVD